MKWGEAMQVVMENRSLFYSHVLDHWRVKKWAEKREKGLYMIVPVSRKHLRCFLALMPMSSLPSMGMKFIIEVRGK